MHLLLLLIACASGPSLSGAAPPEVVQGANVTLTGERLGPDPVPWVRAEGVEEATPIELVSAEDGRVEARIPRGLPPGQYTIGLTVAGAAASLTAPFVVLAEPQDQPCAEDWTSNTELSLAQKRVVLDRFHRDGSRERLELGLDEIVAVQHGAVARQDGSTCSVIWLRTTDDRRVIFDDDAVVDLADRAERIARSMSRPLESAAAQQ